MGADGTMKYLCVVTLSLALLLALAGCGRAVPDARPTDDAAARAFRQHESGISLSGEGAITKVLADDNTGGRHQRFILRLASGQTLLIAHNIDIAPRLPSPVAGDAVAFKGIYEWNAQGGIVHWTHHDPSGQHATGWLKYKGSTFQ
jgi:predicted small lipoprotein YifL